MTSTTATAQSVAATQTMVGSRTSAALAVVTVPGGMVANPRRTRI